MSLRGMGGGAVFLPQASVFADWYDGDAAAIQDYGVATSGVENADVSTLRIIVAR